jgi:hypothetical protein
VSAFLGSRLSWQDDPPAVGGIIYGATSANVFAFTQSQIGASHNDPPRYRWTIPGSIALATVGPDGNLYSVTQTGTRVIQRTDLRAGPTPNTYPIANVAGLASAGFGNLCFFGSAPGAGLDPWAALAVTATGGVGLRYSAACMQGMALTAHATPEQFTGLATANGACLDAAGKLWIAAGSATNRYTGLAGAAGAATLEINLTGANWPTVQQDIAVNAAGDLFVSRYTSGGNLKKLAAATIAGLSGTSNTAPTAVYTCADINGWEYTRFDHAGNLWVASYNNAKYARIPAAQLTGASGVITADIVLSGGGAFGDGSATGPNGMLMFPGTGPVR